MVLLAFDQALKNIQNNGDDRKLKDCFYNYKVNGLFFEHSGNPYVRFEYHDWEKKQEVKGELFLEYQCRKDVIFTDADGKEEKGGCTFPFGEDVKTTGDHKSFDVDTSSPIPGKSVSLNSTLNITFNGQESNYYLRISEDITDKNRHMSIKQMAAHLAAVYCEQLDKNTQNKDGSEFGAQLTKMILKLGRSDVFDGPELDRAYQLEEHRKAVLQKSMQGQSYKSEKTAVTPETKLQPQVHQSWFGNEYYGSKTLNYLKSFTDKTQGQ